MLYIYCIAGMFDGFNVWRIAELKVIGKIKCGEWIEFGHENTIYKLKFGWLKFGKSQTTRQICQTKHSCYTVIGLHIQA